MDLLKDDLKKVYAKFLVTALGSTVITSIYSSVDIIAVGHYCGPDGSAAISCITPLFSIMFSLGLLCGIGGSVWLGNRRGAGDGEDGNRFFTAALVMSVILSALVTVSYIFWREPLLRFFGADDALVPLAMEYSQWLTYAVPSFTVGVFLSSCIRNDGSPALCTFAILLGGVINTIGDFLFVFGFNMGMSGAGLATALGQTVAFFVLISHFFRKKCGLKLVKIKSVWKYLSRIVSAGAASFIVDMSIGITVILFNNQIMHYAGRTELAIYGTVSNVAILFQSLFSAVGQGIQPIVSANFGAGNIMRVRRTLKMALLTAAGMGIGFFALSEIIPEQILRLYMDANEDVAAIGPGIFRVYAISFLLMGINVAAPPYLQSVLRLWQSVTVSLLRGFALCTAFMLVLPAAFGFSAIWWTMPLTELCTMVVVFFFLKKKRGEKTEKVLTN